MEGEVQGPTAMAVLAKIASDPTFRAFSASDFDPAQFASAVVVADSATGLGEGQRRSRAEITMGEMSSHVRQIDAAIQGHITDHRDELLGGVGGIQQLQSDCEGLTVAVQDVKVTITDL